MQSKKRSVIEAWVNAVVGFTMAYFLQWWMLSRDWGDSVSAGETFLATAAFTLMTVTRSYVLRRLFNWLDHKDQREILSSSQLKEASSKTNLPSTCPHCSGVLKCSIPIMNQGGRR